MNAPWHLAKGSISVYFMSPQDVINAMNVNPRISFPPEVDFVLVSALIRETCRVAFAMQTLDPPLDLAFASDGELYNDNKSVLRIMLCLNPFISSAEHLALLKFGPGKGLAELKLWHVWINLFYISKQSVYSNNLWTSALDIIQHLYQ